MFEAKQCGFILVRIHPAAGFQKKTDTLTGFIENNDHPHHEDSEALESRIAAAVTRWEEVSEALESPPLRCCNTDCSCEEVSEGLESPLLCCFDGFLSEVDSEGLESPPHCRLHCGIFEEREPRSRCCFGCGLYAFLRLFDFCFARCSAADWALERFQSPRSS